MNTKSMIMDLSVILFLFLFGKQQEYKKYLWNVKLPFKMNEGKQQ